MAAIAAPYGVMTPPEETTAGLSKEAITQAVSKTAASIAHIPIGVQTPLAELDAAQLIITRTLNSRSVPEPNSPEIRSMST